MSYFCLHQPVVSLYHWISISLVSYLNKNLQRRRQHTTYKNNTTSTTTRFRIKINTLLRAGISAQEKVGYEQNIFVPFLSSPSCIILPPSLTRDFRWVTAPISGFSVIYWCSGTKFGIFVVVVVVVAAVVLLLLLSLFCCCCYFCSWPSLTDNWDRAVFAVGTFVINCRLSVFHSRLFRIKIYLAKNLTTYRGEKVSFTSRPCTS